MKNRIHDLYKDAFGHAPEVCTLAPGRANLIGEHIDYNGGHVLPFAIERGICVGMSLRDDGQFFLVSRQSDVTYKGPLLEEKIGRWYDYVFGVVHEFAKSGFAASGLTLMLDGTIPQGSGLSSSAGLEVAAAWALQSLLGSSFNRMEIALLAQRAENKFVGVNCGIMDQAASSCSLAQHALLLDCSSLEYEHAPLDLAHTASILIAHCGVHRGLSASAYNQRRSECDTAFEALKNGNPSLKCLCDAGMDELMAVAPKLDDVIVKRARHAITEEKRVHETIAALRLNNLQTAGENLNASHQSLRNDYEVSCEELDDLVAFIRKQPGVYGSRLTGAGFGGCTISIIMREAAPEIVHNLVKGYYGARNLDPVVFVTDAHSGVEVI